MAKNTSTTKSEEKKTSHNNKAAPISDTDSDDISSSSSSDSGDEESNMPPMSSGREIDDLLKASNLKYNKKKSTSSKSTVPEPQRSQSQSQQQPKKNKTKTKQRQNQKQSKSQPTLSDYTKTSTLTPENSVPPQPSTSILAPEAILKKTMSNKKRNKNKTINSSQPSASTSVVIKDVKKKGSSKNTSMSKKLLKNDSYIVKVIIGTKKKYINTSDFDPKSDFIKYIQSGHRQKGTDVIYISRSPRLFQELYNCALEGKTFDNRNEILQDIEYYGFKNKL